MRAQIEGLNRQNPSFLMIYEAFDISNEHSIYKKGGGKSINEELGSCFLGIGRMGID
jgi:hypothetical protein